MNPVAATAAAAAAAGKRAAASAAGERAAACQTCKAKGFGNMTKENRQHTASGLNTGLVGIAHSGTKQRKSLLDNKG
jgi:hypothetical protein